MAFELARLGADGGREVLARVRTDGDGRSPGPLLAGDALRAGRYELLFDVGGYFGERAFLDEVPVRFRVADPEAHYHVPLLTSPWAYSTYRGS